MQIISGQDDFLDGFQFLKEEHRFHRVVAGDLQNRFTHVKILQFLRRSQSDQLSVVDQSQPVAIFRFVHVMRGDKYGDSLTGQMVDQIPELTPADGIDA